MYIHSAVDLLTRVEEAVERFLYWVKEVMIYEAVTSSPSSHDVPVTGGVAYEVFDDNGVSSINGSSTRGGGNTSSCQEMSQHQILLRLMVVIACHPQGGTLVLMILLVRSGLKLAATAQMPKNILR
ncbi:PREDICTED: uncharacterized protein LOC109587400 [Amphimedon queenslandica]|uniref:Uncharacterized protein n=1 Tax=Amphimedon queenslandica TaxID=400682 RepID=A0AAN0JQ71_AMPQE|nr:PREDICTED: uncharacterized protein LOC109587400 [Amphimedon queenslandica]|eukprot:XP_019859196.1 PREDICTED: uncharacterized protein LOC109587400 [Amphimedon queenslandica]